MPVILGYLLLIFLASDETKQKKIKGIIVGSFAFLVAVNNIEFGAPALVSFLAVIVSMVLIDRRRKIVLSALPGVVLGGLLQDDYGKSQERIPGLGDVPLFGNLFRAEARSRKKTNLMVFLRPVVVRDGNATEGLSMGRYEQMRGAQIEVQPSASNGLPNLGSPVLPEATRKP